jgi:predicted transcriptional regulator
MKHHTDEGAAHSNKSEGGTSNVAIAAHARAFELDMKILKYIAEQLATSLTSLSKNFNLSEDEMKSNLQPLISRGLVRVQGMVESPAAVYSVTQDGAKKLEAVKTGLSSFI